MAISKELLLLRHGKSDWNAESTDFSRPLNKRGKHNIQKMGEWLAEKELVPDLIISSPANRALSTAEIISETMDLPIHSIETNPAIYEASLADLVLVLSQLPNSVQRLLLVGHNPSFEYLLSYFVPNISVPEDGKPIPTATLACLTLDANWTSLQGDYWTQRAKDLPIE